MKKPNVQVLAASLAIVLLCSVIMSINETPCKDQTAKPAIQMMPSAEVWSDNFDDEDISDWYVIGADMTTDPGIEIEANYSLTGGVLRSLGSDYNFFLHESSVAFGTWTFDVDVQEPDNTDQFWIGFGANYTEDWLIHSYVGDGYSLRFLFTADSTEGNIGLFRSTVAGGSVGRATYTVDPIRGWKNIIMTRDPTGQFYVYVDGELAMGAKDMTVTTSEAFCYLGQGNPALDNITVSNTVDYDKAPPQWVEALERQEITVGADFEYDVNATDYAGIDQYWIDDAENFAIDDNGVITNVVSLAAGTYPITVSVNDTNGNTRSDAFNLVVTGGGFPVEYLVVGGGVVVVVIIVPIIWWMRKR